MESTWSTLSSIPPPHRFSANNKKTPRSQPLCSSHPPPPLKQRCGQVGLGQQLGSWERGQECQLLSTCFPSHRAAQVTRPTPLASVPRAGPWDSLGTRTPGMTVAQGRQQLRDVTPDPHRGGGSQRACKPLCSDSETDKEAGLQPPHPLLQQFGPQSPYKFHGVQGEPWEAGMYPTVSPPAVWGAQHSSC